MQLVPNQKVSYGAAGAAASQVLPNGRARSSLSHSVSIFSREYLISYR